MPKRLVAALGAALAGAALLVGCNTDKLTPPPVASAPAVAPPIAAPSHSLLGGLLGGVIGVVSNTVSLTVGVVHRLVPLDQDVKWSFVAGPGGVISSNRASGLTVTIPPGALSKNVTITVTAKKGDVVDYHFEPEGLQFAAPVTLTQNLSLLSIVDGLTSTLSGQTLRGAYYSSPTLQYDAKTDQATVNELLPTQNYPLLGISSFQIRHFSGYILASCNSDGAF